MIGSSLAMPLLVTTLITALSYLSLITLIYFRGIFSSLYPPHNPSKYSHTLSLGL